eukprot:s826_g27.t1
MSGERGMEGDFGLARRGRERCERVRRRGGERVRRLDDGEVSDCEEQTSWLQHDVTELVNVWMAKMGWNGEHEAERIWEAISDGSKGGGAGDGVTGGVGVALGDIDLHFDWQARRLWCWVGAWVRLVRCDAAFRVAGVAVGGIDLHFVWHAWHLVTSTFTLWQAWRLWHCETCLGVALGDINLHFVAGVALMALCDVLGSWSAVTPRRFVWQAWHLVTSTSTLCAGVALGDIDLHFDWQAWHLWHWVTCLGPLCATAFRVAAFTLCVRYLALKSVSCGESSAGSSASHLSRMAQGWLVASALAGFAFCRSVNQVVTKSFNCVFISSGWMRKVMELASKAVRSMGCCCSVSLARFCTRVLSGAADADAAGLGCTAGAPFGVPLLLPLPVRWDLAALSLLTAAIACCCAAMAVAVVLPLYSACIFGNGCNSPSTCYLDSASTFDILCSGCQFLSCNKKRLGQLRVLGGWGPGPYVQRILPLLLVLARQGDVLWLIVRELL